MTERKKQRRWLWPGLPLAVLFLVFAAWAVVSIFLNAGSLRARIEAEGQNYLHQPVKVSGPITLGLDGWRPAVVAHGVDIGEKPAGKEFPFSLGSLKAVIPLGAATRDFSEPIVVSANDLAVDGKKWGDYTLPVQPLDDGAQISGLTGKVDGASLEGDAGFHAGKLKLEAKIKDLDYSRLAPGVTGGKVRGDIHLSASGTDDRALSRSLKGHLTLIGGAGEVTGSRALDYWAGSVLTNVLPGKGGNTQLRCAVADFVIAEGIAHPKALILETDNAVIEGTGTVDIAGGRLNLKFTPHPRTAALLSFATPVDVTGPFDAVTVTPEASGVAEKIGGLLLGAVAAPAALIPALAVSGTGSACDKYLKANP